MSETLTEKQQLDFSYIYGTVFSLSTTVEYLQAIEGLMAERRANYAMNKAKVAEKACNAVLDILQREITKQMTPEQKEVSQHAVEYHKSLIYDFFLMDAQDQKRIKNLMDKIKREKQ